MLTDSYIKRESLVKDVHESLKNNPHSGKDRLMHRLEHEHFITLIAKQPDADVVNVVRCSKCLYSRELDKTKPPEKYYKDTCVVCQCEDLIGEEPIIVPGDGYCFCGKPKEDSND